MQNHTNEACIKNRISKGPGVPASLWSEPILDVVRGFAWADVSRYLESRLEAFVPAAPNGDWLGFYP